MQDLTGKGIGRYHILEQLGQGGMAIVYKAYDTRLERDVALKIIRIEEFPPSALGRVLKRFEREAKALANLSHPNIVKVHDYGEHEGAPYLVMEYLPGGTLKDLSGSPMVLEKVLYYVLPVVGALGYAHGRGVVHRDVKPANILVTETDQPMLSDFGIAKLLEQEEGGTLTGTGMGVGTPEYMAPEQGVGKAVDHRADVYALGVVLYELLTGRKPFTADTPMAVLLKQIHDPLPDPRRYVSEMPEQAVRVLIKALAKEPSNRYESMEVFGQALERLIANERFQRGASTTDLPPAAGALDSAESTVKVLLEVAQELEKSGSQKAALDTCRKALDKCPPGSPQMQQIKTMIARLEQAAKPPTPARQEMPTRDDLDSAADPIGQSRAQRVERERKKPKSFAAFLRSIPRWAWLAGIWVIIVILLGLMLGQGTNGKGPLAMLASATVTNTSTPTKPSEPTVTATSTMTATPESTATPELGIGSTRISEKDGMLQVYVPAGEFEMGSTDSDIDWVMSLESCSSCNRDWFADEQPQHTVYLDAFWIDQTEVTNAMFQAFVDATGYETDAEKDGASNVYSNSRWNDTAGADWQHPQGPGSSLSGLSGHPVVHVSWNDAAAYCEWAGKRLPSEAEWEKAARGTQGGRTYPWGSQDVSGSLLNYADVNLDDASWADKSQDDGYRFTAPVGSYPGGASPYGALDMAGNVWEWVQDWYGEDYYSSSSSNNPSGPSSGDTRVRRGGGWDNSYNGWDGRSAVRGGSTPSISVDTVGFRCGVTSQ